MIIQLSPIRIMKDALTVWQEPGPEVDIMMDVKNLTFRPDSLDVIYSFHVLDHLFENEAQAALNNWRNCLKPKGELYLVVDDFEFVTRGYVGGDFSLKEFNRKFSHPSNYNKDILVEYLARAGFKEDLMRIWFVDVPNLFKKEEYELVVSAQKHA